MIVWVSSPQMAGPALNEGWWCKRESDLAASCQFLAAAPGAVALAVELLVHAEDGEDWQWCTCIGWAQGCTLRYLYNSPPQSWSTRLAGGCPNWLHSYMPQRRLQGSCCGKKAAKNRYPSAYPLQRILLSPSTSGRSFRSIQQTKTTWLSQMNA